VDRRDQREEDSDAGRGGRRDPAPAARAREPRPRRDRVRRRQDSHRRARDRGARRRPGRGGGAVGGGGAGAHPRAAAADSHSEWRRRTSREGCPFACEAISVCSLGSLKGEAAEEAAGDTDVDTCRQRLEALPPAWRRVAQSSDELHDWLMPIGGDEEPVSTLPRVQLVLSTYHSADQVAAALYQIPGTKRATLTIFDEAHVTAIQRRLAAKGSLAEKVDFTRALREFAVKDERVYGLGSERRLFLTATPRVPDGKTVGKKGGTKGKARANNGGSEERGEEEEAQDEEQEASLLTMDDERTYGPCVFSLAMQSAIEQKLVRDYQVCVVGFRRPADGDETAMELMRGSAKDGGAEKAAHLALTAQLLAMADAMHEQQLHKGFVFFSSINEAAVAKALAQKLFAEARFKQARAEFAKPEEERRPPLFLEVHSKRMPKHNEEALHAFRDATIDKNSMVLVFNVRSLGVGVNVPDARFEGIMSGQATPEGLMQAIGRILRHDKRSPCESAVILLPLAIAGDADDEPTAGERDDGASRKRKRNAAREGEEGKKRDAEMRTVYNVLSALAACDTRLGDAFRKLKRGYAIVEKGGGNEVKVEALGDLRRFLKVEAVEGIDASAVARLAEEVYAAQMERTHSRVHVDEALDALEDEVKSQQNQNPHWRIPMNHVISTSWNSKWQAAVWVASRRGKSTLCLGLRNALTEQQRLRLDKLPYGRVIAADALDLLEKFVRDKRIQTPRWCIPAKLKIPAPWDPEWKGGSWVSSRRGAKTGAIEKRKGMSEEELKRLDALPFGDARFTDDEALGLLEREVQRRGNAWRIPSKLALNSPWDEKWRAGSWLESRQGDSEKARQKRAKMKEGDQARVLNLPYGREQKVTHNNTRGFSDDEALTRLEEEVQRQPSKWRIRNDLTLASDWAPEWNAGQWASRRTGDSCEATTLRERMQPADQTRLLALPLGTGFNTDDALDELERFARVNKAADIAWHYTGKTALDTPWQDGWSGGNWITSRTGTRPQAIEMRSRMSPEQLERLQALPFGIRSFSAEDAVSFLENEVARERGRGIPARYVVAAPWSLKWNAGAWLVQCLKEAESAATGSSSSAIPPELLQRMRKLSSSKPPKNDTSTKIRDFTHEEALTRLEREVRERGPEFRFSARTTLETVWDPKWNAGNWIALRVGNRSGAQGARATMDEEHLTRLYALPYGKVNMRQRTATRSFSFQEAYERLKLEVERRRTEQPKWRIRQKLVICTDWDKEWQAGTWMSNRTPGKKQAEKLTSAEAQQLAELPYGDVPALDALIRLEEEAASHAHNESWRFMSNHVLVTDWDPKWTAGTWLRQRRKHGRTRAALDPTLIARLDKLPYGRANPSDMDDCSSQEGSMSNENQEEDDDEDEHDGE